MYEVFWQPEIRKYKASALSRATLFQVVCVLVAFGSPLLVVYRSYGFWIKEDTYREEPSISFKYQMMLILQAQSTADSSVNQYMWSTFSNLNLLLQENLVSPLVKVREIDNNFDGKKDSLQLSLQVPLADNMNVLSAKLLMIFDYSLVRMSQFRMESLGYLDYSSSLPGGALSVAGDLNFKQKQPLGYKGTDNRYNIPIFNSSSIYAEDYDLSTVFRSYVNRNATTKIENTLYTWKAGRPANTPFVFNATVFYTTPLIIYRPGFWYVIKWAWVQYVPVLLIFLFVFDRIKVFVFQNQIIGTVVQRPHFDVKAHSN